MQTNKCLFHCHLHLDALTRRTMDGGSARKATTRPKRWLIWRFVMIITSVAGFVMQSSYVSVQFFRYDTTTAVEISLRDSVLKGSIAACMRIADLVDFDKIRKETGYILSPIQHLSDSYKVFSSLTVQQMFQYTPHENSSIIKSCLYRPNRWQIREASGAACDGVFSVRRFFTMERMCYVFEQINSSYLTDSMTDQSPLSRARFYQINLDSRFDFLSSLFIVVFVGDLPYRSLDYTSPLPAFKAKSNTRDIQYNVAYASASYYYLRFMPPPYATNCRYERDESYFECRKNCLLQKYQSLDAVPSSEQWRRQFDKKAFIVSDTTDQPTMDRLTEYHDVCHETCDFTPCKFSFSKTTVDVVKEDTGSPFGVTLLTPNDPDIHVTATPTMSIVDYLTFIGSCFGTWFGVSFLSLNPLTVFTWRKKKRQVAPLQVVKLFEPSPTGMGIHIYVRK